MRNVLQLSSVFGLIFIGVGVVRAQPKGKLSLASHFGPQYNFFVQRYSEVPDAFFSDYFLKKEPIGSIAGIELKYGIGPTSRFTLGFSQSRNRREVNFEGQIVPAFIDDFNITHTNRFFEFSYERDWSKTLPNLKYHFGIFYMRSKQQEISINDRLGQPFVEILERNYKSYRLEEGGLHAGFEYQKKIDPHFALGIKTRLYVTVSAGLEALTLTPTLTYTFD
jgi:hypothetical protein